MRDGTWSSSERAAVQGHRFDVDWWRLYVPSLDELVDLDPVADNARRSELETDLAGVPADAQTRNGGTVSMRGAPVPMTLIAMGLLWSLG
jgi:hypothetical protein